MPYKRLQNVYESLHNVCTIFFLYGYSFFLRDMPLNSALNEKSISVRRQPLPIYMTIWPEARRPGPRHDNLARPNHGPARLGSSTCWPAPTAVPCLGGSLGTVGRYGPARWKNNRGTQNRLINHIRQGPKRRGIQNRFIFQPYRHNPKR